MKKYILLLTIVIISGATCAAQEWFTSFDVAKRLALAQDKMLFVMWENTLNGPYYIMVNDENGKFVFADLTQNQAVNETIWRFFIPVVLPEDAFGEFLNKTNEKVGSAYLEKLEDDSIKIMDVNGKILNIKVSSLNSENLSSLIEMYALNTKFLNPYFRNYLKEENFSTSFTLASKYQDFAIFAKNDKTRSEIVRVGDLYFEEARNIILKEEVKNSNAFIQKLDLHKIKSELILNNPRKARRLLKKFISPDIDKINEALFVFLNYTTFMILKDKETADMWKNKIAPVDLKKATLIININ